MSYGVDTSDLNRRAFPYVDVILNAKALGLTIPPSLVLRADHVGRFVCAAYAARPNAAVSPLRARYGVPRPKTSENRLTLGTTHAGIQDSLLERAARIGSLERDVIYVRFRAR